MSISGTGTSLHHVSADISCAANVSGNLSNNITIAGSVSETSTLSGTLSSTQSVGGTISNTVNVTGTLTIGGVADYPEYDGPYEVVPTVEAQTLETAYTLLTDDVTVTAVPYYQVSNVSGDTVYIASEV